MDNLSPEARSWAILIGVWVVFIGFWWFVLIKPRRDAQRRHKLLIEGLKKGDRIITAGGIHGRVISVKEKTCVIEVAEGTRITFDRAAVHKSAEEDEEDQQSSLESKPAKKG